MLFYFCIAFFLCILSLCHYDRNTKIIGNKIVFLIAGTFLLLLAGFRYGFETDYLSYKHIFMDGGRNYERLFVFLIHFCKQHIADDYNAFVFLLAFLSISLKILFFSRLKNPLLALFLYYCLLWLMAETNGIRQGFAISFLLWSLVYVKRRKVLPFLMLVAVAFFCHSSSLIFLPVYVVCHRPTTIKKVVLFLATATAVRLFFFGMIISAIEFLFSRFSRYTYLFSAVRGYLSLGTESLVTVGFIRRLSFVLLFLLLHGHRKIENVYFNTYLLGVCIYILFMGNSVLSIRFAMSFEAALIPLFADMRFRFTRKNAHFVLLMSILSILLLTTTLLKSNAVPYRTYLFQ